MSTPASEEPQKKRPLSPYMLPVGLVALIWIIYAINSLTFDKFIFTFSLVGHDWSKLWASFTAPLFHFSMRHIMGNTLVLLVLGLMVAREGKRRFITVSIVTSLIAGIGVTAFTTPFTATAGSSILIFGYFGYLIFAAIWETNRREKLVRFAVLAVVILLYGLPLISGFVPRYGVSWTGHVFGFLGGVLTAFLLEGRNRKKSSPSPDPRLP